ncbi:hypothetical protein SERLA73DRAFT_142943 [Serpula lacrymans var. lacrymans S7.3]|uniref:Uncharacterized protein n=1 Tax=Serpula lacrymans var. lacrymans (strain S7.3) TaxID=936435 RepID=F8Q8N7_SERL3|nr:hypothetical protein SERLA73DRAFT_142943 [Serpula lacrymans var. lacrymans S7.3]
MNGLFVTHRDGEMDRFERNRPYFYLLQMKIRRHPLGRICNVPVMDSWLEIAIE